MRQAVLTDSHRDIAGGLSDDDVRVLRDYLKGKFGDIDDAEDIVQEALLRVHQAQADTTIENPRAYLFKVAHNIAIDRMRENRQRRLREEKWADVHIISDNGITLSGQPSPEAALNTEQKIALIMAAIKELPENCQRVFILHKFKELSYDEVARTTGLSKSMVGKYMMRALAHLEVRLP